MEVVELLAEDVGKVLVDVVVGGGVSGAETGLANIVYEAHVLKCGEGDFGQGFVESPAGFVVLPLGGEVVGKEEDVFPVLFDEFAACFVDVDVLHGVPGHVVEVEEERMCSDAVARGLGETVGVAFELNAGTELGVEGVVGVVGEVDGAAGLEALGIEVDKLVVADKGDVFDLDVGADVFDLLKVPKGEGVVVAVAEEDGSLGMAVARVQDVGTGVVGNVAVAAVVVVPVLEGHEGRCGKDDKVYAVGTEAGKDFLVILFELLSFGKEPFGAEGDKDGESVETEDVGVVAFARFVGGMVEVEGKDDASHKEESEDSPEGFTPRGEGIEAEKTEEQGEEVVGVVGSGVKAFGWAGTCADKEAVDGWDARDELAVLRGAETLAVVVTAREVPH